MYNFKTYIEQTHFDTIKSWLNTIKNSKLIQIHNYVTAPHY